MDHLYTEYFRGSAVTDQKDRDTWVGDGSPDARQRACDLARKILAAEEKPYLAAETDRAIRNKFEILL
jgi:trimethylamine:corrinoid methyltransferase-like protein